MGSLGVWQDVFCRPVPPALKAGFEPSATRTFLCQGAGSPSDPQVEVRADGLCSALQCGVSGRWDSVGIGQAGAAELPERPIQQGRSLLFDLVWPCAATFSAPRFSSNRAPAG